MKEIKMNTVFETEVGLNKRTVRRNVCMASLDDAWKRGAAYDRPGLAKQFNALSKRICAGAQYWDLAGNMEWPLRAVRESLTELANIAVREDIDRIILPVAQKSPAGKFLAQQLDEVGMGVIVLHEEDYYVSRLQHFGRVDKRRKTGLDFGMVYRKDM